MSQGHWENIHGHLRETNHALELELHETLRDMKRAERNQQNAKMRMLLETLKSIRQKSGGNRHEHVETVPNGGTQSVGEAHEEAYVSAAQLVWPIVETRKMTVEGAERLKGVHPLDTAVIAALSATANWADANNVEGREDLAKALERLKDLAKALERLKDLAKSQEGNDDIGAESIVGIKEVVGSLVGAA
eukprot:gene8264-1533_t